MTNDASSLARNATAAAISSGSAKRPWERARGGGRHARGRGEQLVEHRRVHRPGTQRVHPDALAGELHAELAAHREHATLRRGVGDLRRRRTHHGHERRDVDDRAAALALHVRETCLAAQVHRREVHVLHPAPHLEAGGEDRVVVGRRDARVVERHVDRAEPLERGRERWPPRRLRKRHVSAHEQAVDLGRGGGARVRFVESSDHDVRALGGKTVGGRQPDAAPAHR